VEDVVRKFHPLRLDGLYLDNLDSNSKLTNQKSE